MAARKTIYDGVQEAGIARQLQRRWGAKVQIHPNLPLSKLFAEPQGLSSAERRFFYSSNVDFTLTDEAGSPLLAVEFDGLSGGYSSPTGYIPDKAAKADARRAAKFDFKLRLARESKLPFYIVSFDEAIPRERLGGFTVVDDLIGQFLTREEQGRLINQFVKELPSDADDEQIEDIVLQAGVLAELEMNPLEAFISRASWFFGYKNPTRAHLTKEIDFEEPPAPVPVEMWDLPVLRMRHEALENATTHGTTVIVKIDDSETVVVRTVRVRVITHWFEVKCAAKRIAKYLAWRAVYERLAVEPIDSADDARLR